MRRMIPQSLIDFIKGLAHPQGWLKMLKGSDNITVDESEDGKSVVVDLDQDVKDAISGNNELQITLTDEDWDEENSELVKHVQVNNTYIRISNQSSNHQDAPISIYCPYFKAIVNPVPSGVSFIGYTAEPEDRYIYFSEYEGSSIDIAVFNGLITSISAEY